MQAIHNSSEFKNTQLWNCVFYNCAFYKTFYKNILRMCTNIKIWFKGRKHKVKGMGRRPLMLLSCLGFKRLVTEEMYRRTETWSVVPRLPRGQRRGEGIRGGELDGWSL